MGECRRNGELPKRLPVGVVHRPVRAALWTPDPGFHTSTDLFSFDNSVSTSPPETPDVEIGKPFENNDVDMWKSKSGGPGISACIRRAPTTKPKSDDLPYTGPVVEVPDWE